MGKEHTCIQVKKTTVIKLKEARLVPRESHDSVIQRLIEDNKKK